MGRSRGRYHFVEEGAAEDTIWSSAHNRLRSGISGVDTQDCRRSAIGARGRHASSIDVDVRRLLLGMHKIGSMNGMLTLGRVATYKGILGLRIAVTVDLGL